ncbi:MAG: transcriptional regulator, TetR family [Verrucomicrobia bacterium]|nr:transcriptional regulator, TetR family [Verrucomicrobiota bacterium]
MDSDLETRDRILASALALFARRGYAATSIQDIVAAAEVTKPALYYYFESKAALFQVIVDRAYEERFQLMQDVVGKAETIRERLIEIIGGRFEYLKKNRDLMRVAYATAFAADEELPKEVRRIEKAERNFDFIHGLIVEAQKRGELDARYESCELAFAIHGQMNIYIMNDLLHPECHLCRPTAERIVDLFLAGAAPGRK